MFNLDNIPLLPSGTMPADSEQQAQWLQQGLKRAQGVLNDTLQLLSTRLESNVTNPLLSGDRAANHIRNGSFFMQSPSGVWPPYWTGTSPGPPVAFVGPGTSIPGFAIRMSIAGVNHYVEQQVGAATGRVYSFSFAYSTNSASEGARVRIRDQSGTLLIDRALPATDGGWSFYPTAGAEPLTVTVSNQPGAYGNLQLQLMSELAPTIAQDIYFAAACCVEGSYPSRWKPHALDVLVPLDILRLGFVLGYTLDTQERVTQVLVGTAEQGGSQMEINIVYLGADDHRIDTLKFNVTGGGTDQIISPFATLKTLWLAWGDSERFNGFYWV